MVVINRAFSKAVLLRMSKPFCAEMDVEMATTKGTAKPKACGQEITITVTILSNANTKGNPNSNQTTNVMTPPPRATKVKTFAARSAKFCVLDFIFCASRSEERRVGKASRYGW